MGSKMAIFDSLQLQDSLDGGSCILFKLLMFSPATTGLKQPYSRDDGLEAQKRGESSQLSAPKDRL